MALLPAGTSEVAQLGATLDLVSMLMLVGDEPTRMRINLCSCSNSVLQPVNEVGAAMLKPCYMFWSQQN